VGAGVVGLSVVGFGVTLLSYEVWQKYINVEFALAV
jgi:hypothetical protein